MASRRMMMTLIGKNLKCEVDAEGECSGQWVGFVVKAGVNTAPVIDIGIRAGIFGDEEQVVTAGIQTERSEHQLWRSRLVGVSYADILDPHMAAAVDIS